MKAAAIESALAAAASGRLKVRRQGEGARCAEEQDAYIRERARFFFDDLLPFLRLLRVAD